jgi:hypothetical protein
MHKIEIYNAYIYKAERIQMPRSEVIERALQDNASFIQLIPDWRVFCEAARKKQFTDRLITKVKENHDLFWHLFKKRSSFGNMLEAFPQYIPEFFTLLVNDDVIFEGILDEYGDFLYLAEEFPEQLMFISNKILQDEKQWQRVMITKGWFFCFYRDFPQLRAALFKRISVSAACFSAVIPLNQLHMYLHNFPDERTQFLEAIFSLQDFYLDYFYPGELRYKSSWDLDISTLYFEENRNAYWRAEIVHRLPVVLEWAFKQNKESGDIEVLAYLSSVMQTHFYLVKQELSDPDLARFCSKHINQAVYRAKLEERNKLLCCLNKFDQIFLNMKTLSLVGFCTRAYHRYGWFSAPVQNKPILPVLTTKLECSDVVAFSVKAPGINGH